MGTQSRPKLKTIGFNLIYVTDTHKSKPLNYIYSPTQKRITILLMQLFEIGSRQGNSVKLGWKGSLLMIIL